jgi:hypothetical protein
MLAAAARRRGLAGRVAVMDIAQLLAQSIVPAAGAGGPARGRVSADPEVCHA